jgi:hypothetical protein
VVQPEIKFKTVDDFSLQVGVQGLGVSVMLGRGYMREHLQDAFILQKCPDGGSNELRALQEKKTVSRPELG